MPEGGGHRDDEDAILTALFRYGVIAELLDDRREEPLRARVAEVAERDHHHPKRGLVHVTARTLWTWLRRYRAGGVDALRPRRRKDAGSVRALSAEALARAEALRREEPGRWTRFVMDILARERVVLADHAPHRSTLDRHLRRRGASRRQLRVLGDKRTIKMRVERFGDLWVGDYHHGSRVLAPDGRVVVAKLGAFIDHRLRYPLADRWYVDETLTTLRDTMLRALLRWGAPRMVYVDRGAVYRADQLAYSLAALDCRLVHSRPYYSKGRGVIERWWQLSQAFEREIDAREELVTIHELNRLWEAFRTIHYLEVEHSELGMTPAQAVADVVPRPVDPAVARELFLVRADRTVHASDGCVAVEGRRFLCDSSLRGRKVVVRYDPRDLSSVLVFADGQRIGRAMPQPIGRPPRDHEPAAEAPVQAAPKTDYLGMLRADFDRRLLDAARPLAYADLRDASPGFDESRFLEVVAQVTDARVRGTEAHEAHAFWSTFGPLSEPLVRAALEHAVRLRGTGRHVRVYLAVVRTFVLARLQSLPNGEEK
jgi:transposase InsO family protein